MKRSRTVIEPKSSAGSVRAETGFGHKLNSYEQYQRRIDLCSQVGQQVFNLEADWVIIFVLSL